MHRMTIREKLELMKQVKERNTQRVKDFAEQKTREEKLFDLYERGWITKEELNEKLKK